MARERRAEPDIPPVLHEHGCAGKVSLSAAMKLHFERRHRTQRTCSQDVDDGAGGQVLLDERVAQVLVQIDLGVTRVAGIAFELEDVEAQMIEGGAHGVVLVFGLDDDFVVAVSQGPFFLLLGECPVMSLAAPFGTSAADPTVKDAASGKFYAVAEVVTEVGELWVRLIPTKFVADLEGDRNQVAVIFEGGRQGDQNEMLPLAQAVDQFGRRLLRGEFREVLLHVRNFQTAAIKGILLDYMPQVVFLGSAGGSFRVEFWMVLIANGLVLSGAAVQDSRGPVLPGIDPELRLSPSLA